MKHFVLVFSCEEYCQCSLRIPLVPKPLSVSPNKEDHSSNSNSNLYLIHNSFLAAFSSRKLWPYLTLHAIKTWYLQ